MGEDIGVVIECLQRLQCEWVGGERDECIAETLSQPTRSLVCFLLHYTTLKQTGFAKNSHSHHRRPDLQWKQCFNTEAKLSLASLAIQKKIEKVEKIRSIKTSTASFETKTWRDNRLCKRHRKIMYLATTKPKIPCHRNPLSRKNQQNFRHLKS